MAKRILLVIFLAIFPSAVRGESKPVPKLDWKFTALAGATAGIAVWDMAQTSRCLAVRPGCAESNPLYGPHPTNSRLYGTCFAFDAGFMLASYELRRHGPRFTRKLWMAPTAWVIVGHAEGIQRSRH